MHPALILPGLAILPHEAVWDGGSQTVQQVFLVAGPFALLGLLLARLEGFTQGRLTRRFGWRSLLWTGWLGTPIHELSHAAACLLFRHRIQRIVLFQPDPASGRLGYVVHAYDPKNPLHVVGNFFIGLAPLAGGALALFGLLWLVAPDAARYAAGEAGRIAPAVAGGDPAGALREVAILAGGVLARAFTIDRAATPLFWLFLYAVLCVGSHAAPSRADLRGAWAGGLLLLGLLLLFNILFLASGGRPGAATAALASAAGPPLALFVLAAVLCAVSALAVAALTVERR